MEAVQQAAQLDDVIVVGSVWADVIEESTESADGRDGSRRGRDSWSRWGRYRPGRGRRRGRARVFGFFVGVDLVHEEAVMAWTSASASASRTTPR